MYFSQVNNHAISPVFINDTIQRYTPSMFRWVVIVLLFNPIALSQVRMAISPTDFKSHDRIDVQISNTGKKAVSYSVEFGQVSYKGEPVPAEGPDHTPIPSYVKVESTPIPFHVQKENGGKWSTLLIGPDIGSSRQAVALRAGESQHYPFRLSDRGRMRLALEYWGGENNNVCKYPKGKKTTRSNIFVVN